MTRRIKILPDTLINQIAAGEVVERPASVVKELLENAVDAGGTRILVEVQQAGKTLIRVVDNGRGMTCDDLALSIERHATSKIGSFGDLLALNTMGFRGEALASLAAVSRLTLTSIPEGETSGWRLEIRGGEKKGMQEVAGTSGTVAEVQDLFYNIPARLAFLKSDRSEWNQVALAFERVALGFPHIQWTLRHNGKMVFQLAPAHQTDLRLQELWGGDRTADLMGFQGEETGIRVRGFLSPPHRHVPTARYLAFIVNGRWVRSPVLYPLLLRSYAGLLPGGRYPLAALWLEMPPEMVDVNVHPTKQEVRFSQGEWVVQVVAGALKRALRSAVPVPPVFPRQGPDTTQAGPEPGWVREPEIAYRQIPLGSSEGEVPSPPVPTGQVTAWRRLEVDPEVRTDRGPFSQCTVLGQIHQAYILALSEEGLLLLDQHAAHERILFEKFRNRRRERRTPSQRLLLPVTLDLPPLSEAAEEEFLKVLGEFGLELNPAGSRSYWLQAVPPELGPEQAAEAIREIAESWQSEGGGIDPEAYGLSIIKSMACHGAIRSGQLLGAEEMRSLLEQLDQTENPSHCPHGRPLWFLLSREEIERRFHRR